MWSHCADEKLFQNNNQMKKNKIIYTLNKNTIFFPYLNKPQARIMRKSTF